MEDSLKNILSSDAAATAFSLFDSDGSLIYDSIPDENPASGIAADTILNTLTKKAADTGDEIDYIIITFSNLFQKNLQLNTAIRQHELEIEKSKFTILQEQINPHFLYNSLDTIRICMLMDKKETACSDSVASFGIPKFTLQPIVENSIVHGKFTSSAEPLFIRICVEYRDNIIVITIKDNGPGIPKQRLDELNQMLASQTSASGANTPVS